MVLNFSSLIIRTVFFNSIEVLRSKYLIRNESDIVEFKLLLKALLSLLKKNKKAIYEQKIVMVVIVKTENLSGNHHST